MRTIAIDLAIVGEHKAVVADEQGRFVTPVLKLRTSARELTALLARAREGAQDQSLRVVMEPTGMAWFPVAVFLLRQQVLVYVVNSQRVAALRRFYKRHAKSDRIDSRVLARLPFVSPDELHALTLSSATTLACQRGCKQLDRLMTQITACKNRLQAMDRFAWPGLERTVFSDPFSAAARWFREQWYDPRLVIDAGAQRIRQAWQASGHDAEDDGAWAEALVQLAEEVLALYGCEMEYLDFGLLQEEAGHEQQMLASFEEVHHRLKIKTVRPLYRQIHASRNLESIPGVGQDGAAVYAGFVGQVQRFASQRAFRGWSGLVPDSRQSSQSETKGLHITQAGPDLVRKFGFMDADTARKRDPQLAAVYYDQIVKRGKHHTQAVCACATHLMDRIFAVLCEDRPYQLRDVDGTPVTAEQALAIIAAKYTVPDEVRKRSTKRSRQEQAEQRVERRQERESRPSQVRGKR